MLLGSRTIWFKQQCVARACAPDALASLPVAALRLARRRSTALHDVGIERVAQLASKPRASLQLRFGSEVLLRLDQAFGHATESLTSIMPPEVPRAELRFVEPVGDPDDLKRIIADLCVRLCRTLETRGVGARRLDLIFERIDRVTQAARVSLSLPHRDPKHLAKLLSERLVVIDPGLGIETAVLVASWVEALAERQTIGAHVAPAGAEVDVSQLVDTLAVRLGPQNIFRIAPVESDQLPSGAYRRVPALAIRVAAQTGRRICHGRHGFLSGRNKSTSLPSGRTVRRACSCGGTSITA